MAITRCQFCFEFSAELLPVDLGVLTISPIEPQSGNTSIDYRLTWPTPRHPWLACPICLPLAIRCEVAALFTRCLEPLVRALVEESGLLGGEPVLEHDDFWPHSLRVAILRSAMRAGPLRGLMAGG